MASSMHLEQLPSLRTSQAITAARPLLAARPQEAFKARRWAGRLDAVAQVILDGHFQEAQPCERHR